MTASAYAYAEGGRIPDELVLLRSLDRFGADAIYGRPLSFHEVRMMSLAENVLNAYREREKAGNWADWADKNPAKAALLANAWRGSEELDG